MYKPIKLEAQDFQSFESLSYDFQVGKAVLVEGENRTDEGQKTNGSGKSSFGEMIYYLLLGTPSTGKRDVKLVRRGCKQANLQMTLKNEYLKHELTIKRTLFANTKPSVLEIFIDGKSQNDRYSSVNEGNKLILELLDISSEDLKNFFLINRNRFVSFFDSPDSAKRNLLARFSNIEKLQTATTEIDSMLKDRQDEMNKVSTDLVRIETRMDMLQEQISSKDVQTLYEQTKEALEEKLRMFKSSKETNERDRDNIVCEIFKVQKQIAENEKKLEDLKKQIETLQSVDFDSKLSQNSKNQAKLDQRINDLREKQNKLTQQSTDLSCELQPVLVLLEGAITCPNCKTEFSLQDNTISIEEAKKLVEETQVVLDELIEQKEALTAQIQSALNSSEQKELQLQRMQILNDKKDNEAKIVKLQKEGVQPLVMSLTRLNAQLNQLNKEKNVAILQIEHCEKQEKQLQKDLSELKPDVNNKEIEKLNAQLSELQIEHERIKKQYEDLENLNLEDKQWKERLNQFYVYLTNKTLTLIQSHCNHYLKEIHSDLSLKFDGFKTLADGRIKESVNATISRDGKEEEDYKCFSGGEKGRMIFSTILTFQNFINEKSKSGGLDLILIDEVLDQVDAEGMGLFVDSLKELNKTVFIVSQVKTEAPPENTLLIVKEEGISKVVSE